MSNTHTIAALRTALEAGPTPGPWVVFYKHKYDEWHVSVPLLGQSMRLALFPDGCPTERPEADSQFIVAACNAAPDLLAELDRLRAELDRLTTAARLAVEATPEQLPMALDALGDVLGDNVAGNRLARQGQSELTGLLGGPARSERT